ncbi:hypothetical protein DAH66_17510 [Sphingomonas koreensis]|uniref:beta-N-acetylhexosaminidase n=1 Tax=Sphingomonas koreensis TaxID=93064 RepID=A0A430FZX8_9SPHN|nr:beta-N-acetylhexosaminidase [Sphingomonas koreensis]RSY79363.1 hypothetical protein DAH66_17510 [Sphingomonas koreensis]
MRSRPFRHIALAALALATPAAALAQDPPKSHKPVPYDTRVTNWVTPAMQEWKPAAGRFGLTSKSRIAARGEAGDVARLLAGDLPAVAGVAPMVSAGIARAGDIALEIGDPGVVSQSPEAYSITIGTSVTVRARTAAGLLHGTQSLLQLLKHDPARRSLPAGVASDWPESPRRAMMVDVGRKYFEIDQLEKLMREMAWLKLNTLALHFTDWPAFRLRSEKFPGLADRQSYDRKDIARLEAMARRYHILLIPEIDLPAHASAIIRYKPSLAFNCRSMRESPWLNRAAGEDAKKLAWTVDVTKQENRAFLASVLDEFIPWFSGPYFHIGGDEYQYDVDKTRCPELMDYTKQRGFQYPGDVFVDWINETNKQVRKHGKTTVIWNWWRFKDDKTSIQPDRDILIYGWNSPREQDILDNGYSMLISPEDKLYVVPGIANFDGGGYGVVDTEKVYESMPIRRDPKVLGYMLALWADAGEHRTDTYLLGQSYEPMAVLAERLWSDRGSESLDAFLARLNKTGAAPVRR